MLKYLSVLIGTTKYKSITYSNATDFLNSYSDDGIGCLILDLNMPEINGLELQKQLTDNSISLPVIIISGAGDISTAVKAIKSGILDFLEKPFNNQALLELVHNAVSKHKVDRIENHNNTKTRDQMNSLTQREREVMDLVVTGKLNKDIAKQLEISIKTVEAHRANVMEKMNVTSITDLVRKSLAVKGL